MYNSSADRLSRAPKTGARLTPQEVGLVPRRPDGARLTALQLARPGPGRNQGVAYRVGEGLVLPLPERADEPDAEREEEQHVEQVGHEAPGAQTRAGHHQHLAAPGLGNARSQADADETLAE